MTSYVVEPASQIVERRRHAGDRPRLSWAAGLPFVVQPERPSTQQVPGQATRVGDPLESARKRRAVWSTPLVAGSAAGDAVITALVSAAVASTLGGSSAHPPLVALVSVLIWCLAVLTFGGYSARWLGDGPEEFQAIARASGVVIAVVAVVAYLLPVQPPRREVFVTVPLVAVLTAVHRHFQRRALHRRRCRGDASLQTLIVGDPHSVEQTTRDLSMSAQHGYRVVGQCVSAATPSGLVPTLGGLCDVPQVVVDHQIDAVVVAGSGVSGAALRRLSWALEHTGADLIVVPGLVELTGPNVSLRPTAGLSLLHVEPPSRHQGRLLAKSLIDRGLGLIALLLAAPVLLVAGLAVKFTSPGPVVYRQKRIGRDGKTFTMYKLRTMDADADARRADVLPGSDRDGLMFKMHTDPRITAVGKWLRRFSVDELPQLLNVLGGDMALVGPRPPLPEEFDRYRDQVHRRMRVKPGLTGLWQVSGRSDLSWDESVRLDLRYVDNWSIALDLLILWKTAKAVLRGSGAY